MSDPANKKIQPHQTAPKDRVPVAQKLAYGGGAFADNTMQNGINTMANPVFNMTLGVAPGLISTALSIPRLWDAIVDPFVGSASDNARTRWGRRKPFIVTGSILCGILFALVWMVPHGWSQWGYFRHFLLVSLLFYTAYAVFAMAFGALGMEMSPDYHERTRVMAFKTFFGSVSGISTAWMFWLTQRSCFTDTLHGMRWVGVGIGVMIACLGILPALLIKERPNITVTRQKKIPLLKSLREALGVKPFRLLLYSVTLMAIGIFLVNSLGYYITIYYVYGGDMRAASSLQGWTGTTYCLSSMAALPVITWASVRFGKRLTLAASLCIPFIGTLLKWVCYNPIYPYLQLIPVFLMGSGMAALWTLLGSMVADVADVDEYQNRVRREATLNAVFAWAFKLGLTLALLLSGFVVSSSGFKAELGGNQTVEALTYMRLLYTIVPAIALACTIWIVLRFPIDEKDAYSIRAKLEARRAAQQPS
jgi:GPH family glycoside/pentoside/hexuronide:cation symporter